MYFLGRVQSVQQRHREIEDGHVGMKVTGEANRLVSVGRFAHHLESAALEKDPQTLSDDEVMVGKEDSGGHATGSAGIAISSVVPSSTSGCSTSNIRRKTSAYSGANKRTEVLQLSVRSGTGRAKPKDLHFSARAASRRMGAASTWLSSGVAILERRRRDGTVNVHQFT